VKRLAAMAALGALTIGLAAGCSKAATTAGSNEVQSNGVGSVVTPSAPGSSAPGTTRGTTPKGSTTSKPTTTHPDDSDIPTIPGGPSIPDIPNIPGGGANLQKCLDLANAYSQIFLPLSSSANPSDADIAKATAAIDQIKSQVPANIQADLDTLANGIKNAKGLTGLGEFFSTGEFTKANDEVTEYLTSECSKSASGT
jgi:hypothetical protein